MIDLNGFYCNCHVNTVTDFLVPEAFSIECKSQKKKKENFGNLHAGCNLFSNSHLFLLNYFIVQVVFGQKRHIKLLQLFKKIISSTHKIHSPLYVLKYLWCGHGDIKNILDKTLSKHLVLCSLWRKFKTAQLENIAWQAT